MSLSNILISVMSLAVFDTYNFHDNEWPIVKNFEQVHFEKMSYFMYDLELFEPSSKIEGLNAATIYFMEKPCDVINPEYLKSRVKIGKLNSYDIYALQVVMPGGEDIKELIDVPLGDDACVSYVGDNLISPFIDVMLPASELPYELY